MPFDIILMRPFQDCAAGELGPIVTDNAGGLAVKPTALGCDSFHLLAYLRIVRRTVAPDSFGVDTNEPTRPTLRDIMIPHRPKCSFPSFT